MPPCLFGFALCFRKPSIGSATCFRNETIKIVHWHGSDDDTIWNFIHLLEALPPCSVLVCADRHWKFLEAASRMVFETDDSSWLSLSKETAKGTSHFAKSAQKQVKTEVSQILASTSRPSVIVRKPKPESHNWKSCAVTRRQCCKLGMPTKHSS